MVWGGENERTVVVMPDSILTSVRTTLVGKFFVTDAVISVGKLQLFSTLITKLGSRGKFGAIKFKGSKLVVWGGGEEVWDKEKTEQKGGEWRRDKEKRKSE